MSLDPSQKVAIQTLLASKLEAKLKKYARESTSMPFLVRLIQDHEKVAAYSFIHSIATTLGMSIYEEVSRIITSSTADEAFTKVDLGGVLSRDQKVVIANIVRELRNGTRQVNKAAEVREVLRAPVADGRPQREGRIADFYMKRSEKEYYFEIKTVKPNIDIFTASKVKLLEWVARKRKPVETVLAFPYNPYYPRPYERFTMQGLVEPKKELLVDKEYWDFLGGGGTFDELLEEFDKVGRQFRTEIARKIQEVAREKMRH